MVKIISEIGYCKGVENAIEKLSLASKKSSNVFLLHPLLHNIKENDFLMGKNNASYINSKDISSSDTLLFSAHGYRYSDYNYYKEKMNIIIGTCPIILARYKILDKADKSLYYIFLGKKGHEETEAFISNFPFINFINVNDDIKKQIDELNINNKNIFFIPQTTLSKFKAEECFKILNKNNKVVNRFDICQSYYNRIKEIDLFLSNVKKDYILFIIGDKLSSNANEIYNYIFQKYKCQVYITNSFDEIKIHDLSNKDIFLTSATSSSKNNVLEIKKKIENYLLSFK